MTKTKMFGGALIGAAMAVGCAGGPTSVDTAQLDVATVSSSVDGRTDLFLDPAQSRHLLTLDEVNGSPTAIAVTVEVTTSELIAWRSSVPAANRTDADIVGHFDIIDTTPDLSTAQFIDNETHPGQPGTVVIPGGVLGGFHGGRATTGNQPPRLLNTLPPIGLVIDWATVNGIPNAVDVNTYNASRAHPGCA